MRPFCHILIKGVRWDSPTPRETLRSLCKRLKKFRLQLSLSQSEMARRLGVSLRTLRGWELGEVLPRGNRVQRIKGVINGVTYDSPPQS